MRDILRSLVGTLRFHPQYPPGARPGEPGAATSGDGAAADDEAPGPADTRRPAPVGLARAHLAGLAPGGGGRATSDGRPLVPAAVPHLLGTEELPRFGPAPARPETQHHDPEHQPHQSALGRPAYPQRTAPGPRQHLRVGLPPPVHGLGIREVLTAARSPWQNPYVERVIGSIRRECLDHVIPGHCPGTAALPAPGAGKLIGDPACESQHARPRPVRMGNCHDLLRNERFRNTRLRR